MDYLGRVLRKSHRLDLDNTDHNRLLVIRQGGFGDLLFISGVATELKRRHPHLSIDLMCQRQYQRAFHLTKSIDQLLDHSWPSLFHFFDYDYFVILDGVVECDPEATTRNIYDLLSEKYFGITMAENSKIPSLGIDLTLLSEFKKKLPVLGSDTTNIGLQLFANSPIRTPSLEFWKRMVSALLNNIPNARVFLLAEAGRASQAASFAASFQDGNVLSTAGIAADVAQLSTLVSMMDCIVAPDSSVIHLSAAFQLPAIGVYGPFPSAFRIRSYAQAVAIDAPATCAPCFTHGHWPCRQARAAGVITSPCFDQVPEQVIEGAIERMLTKLANPPHERTGLGSP